MAMCSIFASQKTRIAKLLAVLFSAMLVAVMGSAFASKAYAETPVFTDWAVAQSDTATVGDTLTVDVYISASTNFNAAEIGIAFPADKLSIVASDVKFPPDLNYINQTETSVDVGLVNIGFVSESVIPASEQTKIATLTFTVIAAGSANISMIEDPKYSACISGEFGEGYPITAKSSASVTLKEPEYFAQARALSLNATGKIGVRAKIDIPEALRTEGAYARIYDGDVYEDIPFADAEIEARTGYYVFEHFVVARDIENTILLKLFAADGTPITLKAGSSDVPESGLSYSISMYCRSALTSSDEELVLLAKALLDYGHTADVYLTDNNADVSGITLEQADRLDAVSVDNVSSFKASPLTVPSAITLGKVALELNTDTAINVYITLAADANIADYSFMCNGVAIEPLQTGATYRIAIPNIAAQSLDDFNVITCNGEDMVSIPALFWSRAILKNTASSDASVLMAKTLYLYNQAANAYFANN